MQQAKANSCLIRHRRRVRAQQVLSFCAGVVQGLGVLGLRALKTQKLPAHKRVLPQSGGTRGEVGAVDGLIAEQTV
jgi:hypothetical protein